MKEMNRLSLNNSDYREIENILNKFAKNLSHTTQSSREVKIPLSEYEDIKKHEKLYYQKVELLEDITKECKLILKINADDWDNKTLYDRIYKIYSMIVKGWL